MTREEAIKEFIREAKRMAIKQEPCEDAISRKQAIELASGACHPANVAKELTKHPSVNPQPCEDAISRKDTLKAMIDQLGIRNEDYLLPAEATLYKVVKNMPPVTPQPKTGRCKDCKWWKDSDGTFRRGVKAESRCPINRKEVFEGNGYCYLFEPQERSE